jgi:N-acetylglutamate synthase-like GNAT family acetyltransferase
MIQISLPTPEDSVSINEIIKLSWYTTYVRPDIGVTKEDVDSLYRENESGQIEALTRRAINPEADDLAFVAKEDGKVIGYIRCKIFETTIELRTMYVHPDYVGKGIGTMLWESMLDVLPQDKEIFTEPVLHTKAVDFYKKIGFIDTGERYDAPDAMPDSGVHLPLIKMKYNGR